MPESFQEVVWKLSAKSLASICMLSCGKRTDASPSARTPAFLVSCKPQLSIHSALVGEYIDVKAMTDVRSTGRFRNGKHS